MKTYGWTAFVAGVPESGGQVRAICAAASIAEVARVAGVSRPSALFQFSETVNSAEMAAARQHPGKMLVTCLTGTPGPFRVVEAGKSWAQLQVVSP